MSTELGPCNLRKWRFFFHGQYPGCYGIKHWLEPAIILMLQGSHDQTISSGPCAWFRDKEGGKMENLNRTTEQRPRQNMCLSARRNQNPRCTWLKKGEGAHSIRGLRTFIFKLLSVIQASPWKHPTPLRISGTNLFNGISNHMTDMATFIKLKINK